jgi:hypothetical protein
VRISFHAVVFAAISLFLSGCLETTDIYTVNPDGSGKVVHEVILPIVDMEIAVDLGPEIQLKKKILAELKNGKGIEAWDEISYKYIDEEKFYFKGTAYFRDLSALKFHNSGITIPFLDRIVLSREGEQFCLELQSSEKENEKGEKEKTAINNAPELSDAEVEQRLAKVRKDNAKTKIMLTELFTGYKIDRTFYLPGTIAFGSNFELNEDRSVRNNLTGSKIIELTTGHFEDDEWLRQQIRNGKELEEEYLPDAHTINERLFGQKGPVLVVMAKPDSPLFNYVKEVDQARLNFQNILAGLEPLKTPVPTKIDPESNGEFFVAAMRYISFDDVENGIQPLGYRRGYTIAVTGTVPEKAIKLLPGKVDTALTDTGDSLLPENDRDREISWPTLGRDGRTVLLDLDLNTPGHDVKSLKKLSGTFGYLTSAGEYSMIDLGISKFEKGMVGDKFGAKVISAGADSLVILIDVVKDGIKSFKLFNEQGKEADVIYSFSWSPMYTLLNFSPTVQGQSLPLQGNVHVEMLADFKVYEIEFDLTDIPLLR